MTAIRCRWCGETRERELVAVAGRHVCVRCWRLRTDGQATYGAEEPAADANMRRLGAPMLPGLE